MNAIYQKCWVFDRTRAESACKCESFTDTNVLKLEIQPFAVFPLYAYFFSSVFLNSIIPIARLNHFSPSNDNRLIDSNAMTDDRSQMFGLNQAQQIHIHMLRNNKSIMRCFAAVESMIFI